MGSPLIFPNSITITKEGIIYFTDSSTKYPRARVMLEILEACPVGRLFSYNPETEELKLLLDGLYFPNGVQLNPTEDALIFAETTKCRIMKYYISGPKTGTLKPLIGSVPGFPDNIKYSPSSKLYWVGLSPRSVEYLMSGPIWLRKIISKIDLNAVLSFFPSHGIVMAIDEEGNTIHTLHDPKGRVSYISEIVEKDGFLLMGSWRNDFIAFLDVRKILMGK